MVIKCLECYHKCGLPFNLTFHYSIRHEDKISKCECGDITLSGICIKELAQQSCFANSPKKTDCSFKYESGYNSSSNSNCNSNSNSSSNSNSNSNSSCNSSSNSNSNSNSSSNSSSNTNSISSSNSNSSISSNSNSNYNSNSNSNFNTKVLTRSCNKCNSVKPLNDFDESKYTCRNCTSAKVNCLYCPSVVRYDGIRTHVKRQHPNVELTTGFSRNLIERSADPRSTKLPLRGSVELFHRSVIGQTGESCSCKYYYIVSFLINNGINIEKAKGNINLLKSIDNLK